MLNPYMDKGLARRFLVFSTLSRVGLSPYVLVQLRRMARILVGLNFLSAVFTVGVVAAFLVPRLAYFVDYPLPLIQPDTFSYFDPVREIFAGEWPHFGVRTPGYPLFLAAVLAGSPRLSSVIIVQNLLTIASVLFLLWSAHRTYPRLVPGVALALMAHVSQPLLSGHDFAILTESLFTSCMLFFFGFMIQAVHTERPRNFLLCSLVGGFAIIVRPAGAFLFGGLLLVLVYLLVNRRPWRKILPLAIPMPAMILTLLIYNQVTLGFFGLSEVSTLTTYAITSPYWEPDPSFPESVNAGIRRFREEIPEADKNILYYSWDPTALYPLFLNSTVKSLYRFEESVFSVPADLDANERKVLAGKIARKAISSHPDIYAKFVFTNLYLFIRDPSSWYAYLYGGFNVIYRDLYAKEGIVRDPFIFREYTDFPNNPHFEIRGQGADRHLVVAPTFLYEFHLKMSRILTVIFDNKFWLIPYAGVLIISFFILIKSKFRHKGALLVFTIASMLAAAGLVVASITTMSNRYPSPTRFIEYLSVALAPLLFSRLRHPK